MSGWLLGVLSFSFLHLFPYMLLFFKEGFPCFHRVGWSEIILDLTEFKIILYYNAHRKGQHFILFVIDF